MIKYVFFLTALLVYFSYTASPGNYLSANAAPASPIRIGNCPATPPPAAQRAGFTTLAYCLDGANPANATLSNWVNCTGMAQANSKIWSRTDGYCDSQH